MTKPDDRIPNTGSGSQASAGIAPPVQFQSTEWRQDVREGKISGYSIVDKYGRNDTVPSGSWQHVNLLGSAAWQAVALHGAIRIAAGGNAADTAAGAGAREVTVQGLKADRTETTQVLVPAGAAASAAGSIAFRRAYRAWVSAAGTYRGANVGAMTIEDAAGTRQLLQIAAAEGQTQFAAYSVPANKTAWVGPIEINVDSTKSADIRLWTAEDLSDTTAPMAAARCRHYWAGISAAFATPEGKMWGPYAAESDIWFDANANAVNTQVSVNFEILLIDD